jgi:hypothetical protein
LILESKDLPASCWRILTLKKQVFEREKIPSATAGANFKIKEPMARGEKELKKEAK